MRLLLLHDDVTASRDPTHNLAAVAVADPHFCDKVTDSDWCVTRSSLDIMSIREGSSVLKFSDDSTFSASELSFIVLHVATNRTD